MTMPQLTFELPDTAVVTGASSGLGHELCSLLVEAGVATVGVDLAAAQDNLAALAGYHHVAGDVAGEATWEKVVARLRSSGAKRHRPRDVCSHPRRRYNPGGHTCDHVPGAQRQHRGHCAGDQISAAPDDRSP
ncbi:SDR family NAD(P)-dependent oxidoreductase [Rhizobium leguminosarum]|nr:SDR family NAD(P)-dependent oxidoreductase [Rhizobium leguminosarum]